MYTFETLLHQELGKGPTKEELCKSIQRILERVLKVSASPHPTWTLSSHCPALSLILSAARIVASARAYADAVMHSE